MATNVFLCVCSFWVRLREFVMEMGQIFVLRIFHSYFHFSTLPSYSPPPYRIKRVQQIYFYGKAKLFKLSFLIFYQIAPSPPPPPPLLPIQPIFKIWIIGFWAFVSRSLFFFFLSFGVWVKVLDLSDISEWNGFCFTALTIVVF